MKINTVFIFFLLYLPASLLWSAGGSQSKQALEIIQKDVQNTYEAFELSKQAPTLIPSQIYQDIQYIPEYPSPFVSTNTCHVERLEPNTWEITSPPGNHFSYGAIHLMDLPQERGLALYRLASSQYAFLWPAFWEKAQDIPQKSLFLLWEHQPGVFAALISLMGQDSYVEIQGVGKSLFAHIQTENISVLEQKIPLAICGYDTNPYLLIDRLIRHARGIIPSFTLRHEKPIPKWSKYLGWTSWYAFQKDVNQKKLLQTVMSFEEKNIPLGYMILDEGWQSVDEKNKLLDLESNRNFILGLKPIIKEAKKRLPLKAFGIWHPLQGYWNGIAANTSYGKKYHLLPTGFPHPQDFERFINDLHKALKREGVDFVKVDNESNTRHFFSQDIPYVANIKTIFSKLEDSVEKYLGKGIIHSMSHENALLFCMNKSPFLRSSNPIFPKVSRNADEHIIQNAYNSLWLSQIAYPDWDTFQTHMKRSMWHAAARALSGGPIYIADKPDQINKDLINMLILPDGKLPHLNQCAVPTRTSLFNPPQKHPPLKIWNRSLEMGLVGVFNVSSKQVNYLIGPQDAEFLQRPQNETYLLWSRREGFLAEIGAKDWTQRKIDAKQWDIVIISCVKNGVAVIGNPEAFNAPGWIEKILWTLESSQNILQVKMRNQGPLLLYSKKRPFSVFQAGVKIPFSWDGRYIRIDLSYQPHPTSLELLFLN